MRSKFKIGDKVKIIRNSRTPKEILDNIRLDHPRTITAIYYDNLTQHNRYYLGTNKRGILSDITLSFRSEQLKLAN